MPRTSLQNSPPLLAFFPLTGGELDSLLLPPYNGTTSGMPLPAWVDDATFNSTINCTAVSGPVKPGVEFVGRGSWTVAFFRAEPMLPRAACGQHCLSSNTQASVPLTSPATVTHWLLCLRFAPSQAQKSAVILDNVPYASNGKSSDSHGKLHAGGRGGAVLVDANPHPSLLLASPNCRLLGHQSVDAPLAQLLHQWLTVPGGGGVGWAGWWVACTLCLMDSCGCCGCCGCCSIGRCSIVLGMAAPTAAYRLGLSL